MATYYWVGGTGTWNNSNTTNWSTASGGAGGAGPPLSTDIVIFDSASGTGTCTTAAGSACATATLNSSTLGLTLGANHTMSGTFTLTLGTLSLGSFTLTCNIFSTNNSNPRTIAFGTGNITLTGNGATIWTSGTATNFSYTGTPTINAIYAGATGTRTFAVNQAAGGSEANALSFNISAGTDTVNFSAGSHIKNLNFLGFSGTLNNAGRIIYGNLTLSATMTLVAGGASISFSAASGTQLITSNGRTVDFPLVINTGGTVAFQDALTQGATRNFTFSAGAIQFKNGVTSTVGNFITSGTTRKYLQSTSAGSQATLSEASGTVTATYLTIQDINATGGATWNAYVDQFNIDAGNNDGWDFGISPVIGGVEYTYQLRSFTEPWRF